MLTIIILAMNLLAVINLAINLLAIINFAGARYHESSYNNKSVINPAAPVESCGCCCVLLRLVGIQRLDKCQRPPLPDCSAGARRPEYLQRFQRFQTGALKKARLPGAIPNRHAPRSSLFGIAGRSRADWRGAQRVAGGWTRRPGCSSPAALINAVESL